METVGGFEQLIRSWMRHLRAENKSPRTLETYGEAAGQFATFIRAEGIGEIGTVDAACVERFIGDLLAVHSPRSM